MTQLNLDPGMVHGAWWRHESRAAEPPHGNVVDRYVALHPDAPEFAMRTKMKYLKGVTPHLVFASDVSRAALTAGYAYFGSQIIIDPRLGFPEGDDVWNQAFLDVPWTATGQECFAAAPGLVMMAAARVRNLVEEHLTRAPLGSLVSAFGHAPTMDTLRATLEAESAGMHDLSWSPTQFGSGAFVIASYQRSGTGLHLQSVQYCPAYRPAV